MAPAAQCLGDGQLRHSPWFRGCCNLRRTVSYLTNFPGQLKYICYTVVCVSTTYHHTRPTWTPLRRRFPTWKPTCAVMAPNFGKQLITKMSWLSCYSFTPLCLQYHLNTVKAGWHTQGICRCIWPIPVPVAVVTISVLSVWLNNIVQIYGNMA